MPNNYKWVMVKITTENRDRPGGHGDSYARDGMGWREPHSPEQARFYKKQSRKKQRRENNRIKRQALREYEADQYDLLNTWMLEDLAYADDFNAWYNDHQYDDDYTYDLYQDHDDPSYYEDWGYYDYGDMDYFYIAREYRRKEDVHDRIIKPEDSGKTLGELLEEFRIRNINYDY